MAKGSSKHDASRGRMRRPAPQRESFGGIPLSLLRRYRDHLGRHAAGGRAGAGPPARQGSA